LCGRIEKTFEILDGVRRAKAAAELGQETIQAEVVVGEKVVQTGEVPVSAPAVSEGLDRARHAFQTSGWLRVLNGTRDGDALPPIRVQPGSSGTPVSDVDFTF
jgi:hypothetical protein